MRTTADTISIDNTLEANAQQEASNEQPDDDIDDEVGSDSGEGSPLIFRPAPLGWAQ